MRVVLPLPLRLNLEVVILLLEIMMLPRMEEVEVTLPVAGT